MNREIFCLQRRRVAAEIGELLNGEEIARKGRPVVFKSVGIAVEDIAAAKLVHQTGCGRSGLRG